MPEQCGLAAAERASDEGDGSAVHIKNDEARMTNDELMTNDENQKVRGPASSFYSSFYIPDWCEPRDWLADPGQLGGFDHFVNVLVGGAGLLGEARP